MIVVKTRTPYSVIIDQTNQTQTRLELSVWNKGQIEPVLPNFVFSQNIPSLNSRTTYYNISEYLNDYIGHLAPITFSSSSILPTSNNDWCLFKYNSFALVNGVWVAVASNVYGVGVNGYSNYVDGVNSILDLGTTTANTGILLLENYNGLVYKYNDIVPSVNILAYSPSETFALEVAYYSYGYINSLTSYGFSGNANEVYNLSFPICEIGSINSYPKQSILISIYTSGVYSTEFNSEFICESKYTPIFCSYVNKYGGWDSITFFKASSQNIDVQSTSYNVSDVFNYNISRGQKQTYNVNGNRKIKVNTGWIDEKENSKIEQLMLSEKILLDNLPVTLITKSYEEKTYLKDRNINYTIEFEYAFNLINDVQ